MLSHHLAAPTRQPIGAADEPATGYGCLAPRSHHVSGGTGPWTAQPGRLSRRIDRCVGTRGQLTDESRHLDAMIDHLQRKVISSEPAFRSGDRRIASSQRRWQ
jgi:hypothetical protein